MMPAQFSLAVPYVALSKCELVFRTICTSPAPDYVSKGLGSTPNWVFHVVSLGEKSLRASLDPRI